MTTKGAVLQLVASGTQNTNIKYNEARVLTLFGTAGLPMHISDFEVKLSRDCDKVDKIFLSFSGLSNCNVIDNIKLIVDGNYLQDISGRFLCLLGMLSPGFDPTSIKIPFMKFPVISVVLSPYYEIQTSSENLDQKTKETLRENYMKVFEQYLIRDLAQVVFNYLGSENLLLGNMEVHVEKIFMCVKRRTEEQERKNHIMSVDQFVETKGLTIPKGQTSVKIDLANCGFSGLCKKIIFAFRKVGGPNLETLPILKECSLSLHGQHYNTYSRNTAHKLDKMRFGDYVPDEAIYTLTFTNGMDMKTVQTDPSSYMNFSQVNTATFTVIIEPQPYDVELTTHGEFTNFIVFGGGSCCIRYVS